MKNKFEIEVTYKASVGRVWNALTDRDQLRQWYFDISDFKPEVGFMFGFSIANIFHHICTVTEVAPQRKLAYTWKHDGFNGASHVMFELVDEGVCTRMKLVHDDLHNHEDFFESNPGFPKDIYAASWTPLITRMLKDYVERY